MDKLDILFKKQIFLQNKLNNKVIVGDQKFINIMILACIDELTEALRETPWKPWKKHQKFNQESFKEELVDLWHFVINLTLASGMTSSELFDRYNEKNKINHLRKEQGY